MAGYILLFVVIILICLILHNTSSKLGIPMLLAFIVLGMIFGSDGLVKLQFDEYVLAQQVCSVALIFIMFYGGYGTSWKSAKPVATKAILLSSVGVILTALLVGLFSFFVLHIDFWESMLIGSVISSTDAASVFSILRSKRLNLRDNTAPLLEIESGSNDPCAYMLTIAILTVMNGKVSGGELIYMMFAQVAFGLLFGICTARISHYILGKMQNAKDGIDTIFVFTMALFAYAGAEIIGGNGYLSVYIAGIILGNQPSKNKIAITHFFDGITGLIQMSLFFLLGLLSFPSQFVGILKVAIAIAVFLTLVARPVAVFAILAPFKCSFNQKILVSWAGLRGAASIVFAMMATNHPAYMKNDIFHIVFFVVLFSISIQGTLIPFVSRKLGMIDDNTNIMKTFSDYSEEIPIQFIKVSIAKNHPWNGKTVKDIKIIPDILLVLILRGKERIVPKGNTTIREGDAIVLSAFSVEDHIAGALTELIIDKENDWLGKTLKEVKLGNEKIIVAIKRQNKVLIPNGKTILKEQDVLVISQR
ncbi:MAG: potassium/proton antiporter [Lachnospiraceae bacterium]|nr:potassium/proton antiporter [Lachnospiraceae bacterium]